MLATSDLCDSRGDEVTVIELPWRHFGQVQRFGGAVATLKIHEDNALVREALSQPGGGRVLVVDGGGSFRCALLGGNLAAMAVSNGWAGVVIFGCVRDAKEIASSAVGVVALGTCPRRSNKAGTGQRDVPLRFGGALVRPGDHLVADEDGVIVGAALL